MALTPVTGVRRSAGTLLLLLAATACGGTQVAPVTSHSPTPGATVEFVRHPADSWTAELTLHPGDLLQITLEPAAGYRWAPVVSSDPAVATATGDVAADGTALAAVRARTLGKAILTADTTFVPDPFGPPTRRWQLTLHVVPST